MSIRQSDFYLLPNILSVSRVVAVPLIVLLLYWEWNLAALGVFIGVGISDYIDGWVARRYHYESKLGMLLDPLADKLIILSTMIMLLWINRLDVKFGSWNLDLLGPVLVVVTVGREMAITGLRAMASSIGLLIPADRGGKIKTWIQFIAISALIYGSSPLLEVGQVLLLISVFAALWSGIVYTIRFLKALPR
jgi:CDP-diacylglycerol--glycerol-3-phosphate 3-phosphatidyltransferase